jgi:thiol-disulfide isomerase/thioredoxin
MDGITEQIKGFLNVPFNRYLVAALVVLGIFMFLFDPTAQQAAAPPTNATNISTNFTVHFFYSPTCPHCAAQKPFNEQLAREFPQISFVYHDVTRPEEIELLQKMYEEYSLDTTRVNVPTTFVGKQAFVGFSELITPNEIHKAIVNCLATCANQTAEIVDVAGTKTPPTAVDIPVLGKTSIAGMSLPILTVVLGLVDGFNPCAMWVLVYLIALVMETGLKDPKRIWLIVGTFVLASGVLYFLFMTAWLNVFLILGYVRPVTILIGLIALGGGALSLKEYIETRGGALTCEVVGGEEKKKTIGRMQQLVSAPLGVATIIGIIALAFVVNSVEFVCSSAIPAIFTQVLALSNLAFWQYYAYIAAYVFFFMLDDLIIFGLAAFAVAGGVGERYSKYSRVIGGSILLILGMMLLFAPNLLR